MYYRHSLGFVCVLLALASIAGCPTAGDGSNDAGSNDNSSNASGGTDGTGGGSNDPIGPEPLPSDGGSGGSNDGGSNANDNDDDAGNTNDNTADGSGDSGDGGSGDDGGGSSALLAGTFAGSIVVTSIQNVGDTFTDPADENHTVQFQFDDAGVALAIPILGFVSAPDAVATVNQVGESETLPLTISGGSATLDVTVTEATYTTTTARIVYDLFFDETLGNLAQSGPGTQTVEVSVDGDTLTVTIATDYDVNITAPVSLDTGEQLDSTGSLPRQ